MKATETLKYNVPFFSRKKHGQERGTNNQDFRKIFVTKVVLLRVIEKKF